jgi:hypothetical protein
MTLPISSFTVQLQVLSASDPNRQSAHSHFEAIVQRGPLVGDMLDIKKIKWKLFSLILRKRPVFCIICLSFSPIL